MPISMSDAKLDHDTRDTLLSSNITAPTTASYTANTTYGGGSTTPGIVGADLAGITPQFVSATTQALETYATSILTALSQLEAVNSSAAFQGTGVTTALSNFVTGVKEVANSYVEGLRAAEVQIMNSVHTVYSTQDQDLSGQMGTDTSSLEEQRVTTSGS